MVTKGLNKITQNETQDPQLVDNFCKSWDGKESGSSALGILTLIFSLRLNLKSRLKIALRLGKDNNPCAQKFRLWKIKMAGVLGFEPR